MSPYMQHARRHLPGGTDPIPLTPNLPYIAGDDTFSVASDTSGHTLDLDPSTISWGTEAGAETASDYFDLQLGGSSYHAITLLKNGLYVAFMWAQINIASAPAANAAGAIGMTGGNFTVAGRDDDPFALSVNGTTYISRPTRIAWLNWPASYATPPIYHWLSLEQNSGSTLSPIVSFMVVRINEGNDGF